MEDAKIIMLIICCFAIAGFVYAVYISDPPLLELNKLNATAKKVDKVDEELRQKFSLNPEQKVRMFVSVTDNETIRELEKQVKVIKKGKYTNFVVVEGDYSTLQKLVGKQTVVRILYDGKVKAVGFTIKPVIQDANWNIEAINADVVHRNNFTGKNSVVAILDTGVNYHLEDLNDNYIGGYDIVYNDSDPDDKYGHGTNCAGIIAGEGEVIYKGVAPDTHYYAVKVLNDEGWGNWSDVVAGLEWCLDKIREGYKIDIISMSLGASEAPTELKVICDMLYSEGVILVGASGNEGQPVSIYPARYDTVISVGAVDINKVVATFSNGGSYVVAPGVQVPVLEPDESIRYSDGTSLACPHVAGVLALVESEKDITPSQAFNLLKISTNEITDLYDKSEYGEIDAVKCINNALNMDIKDIRYWYDYLKEPAVQVALGLILLIGFSKVFARGE